MLINVKTSLEHVIFTITYLMYHCDIFFYLHAKIAKFIEIDCSVCDLQTPDSESDNAVLRTG